MWMIIISFPWVKSKGQDKTFLQVSRINNWFYETFMVLNPETLHPLLTLKDPQNDQTHSNNLSAKSTNCLSVLDQFVGLALKALRISPYLDQGEQR